MMDFWPAREWSSGVFPWVAHLMLAHPLHLHLHLQTTPGLVEMSCELVACVTIDMSMPLRSDIKMHGTSQTIYIAYRRFVPFLTAAGASFP